MTIQLIVDVDQPVKYHSNHYNGTLTNLRAAGEYNGRTILKADFKGTVTNRLFHVTSVDPCEKTMTLYGVRQWELDSGVIRDHSCG